MEDSFKLPKQLTLGWEWLFNVGILENTLLRTGLYINISHTRETGSAYSND